METVEKDLQSFLYIYENIICESSKTITSVYGKAKLDGGLTYFESFIPVTH